MACRKKLDNWKLRLICLILDGTEPVHDFIRRKPEVLKSTEL